MGLWISMLEVDQICYFEYGIILLRSELLIYQYGYE